MFLVQIFLKIVGSRKKTRSARMNVEMMKLSFENQLFLENKKFGAT